MAANNRSSREWIVLANRLGLSRREFLRLSALGAAGVAFGGCGSLEALIEKIKNRPVRKNITSLADTDPILVAYRAAITAMKALPSTDPRNWTNQAKIHYDHCPHGNWLFLPWHRAYLYYFEDICRELSGMEKFALPYWDWSNDLSIPSAFWGASTNALYDSNRIATDTSVAASSMVGPATIQGILEETNFISFASDAIAATDDQRLGAGDGPLEGTPHNYIHGFVGGDMGAFMSPLDPIFWTHHNQIERIWVEWNLVRGNPNTNDSAWTNRKFTEFSDRHGNAVSVTVFETLLYPLLLYRYDAPIPIVASAPSPYALAAAEPQTNADAKQLQQFLERGARVERSVVRRFESKQAMTAEISRPAVVKVAADGRALMEAAAGGGGLHARLRLNGVTLDHTEDFYVRVFLNEAKAGLATPLDRPGYTGGFAFFGHAGMGDHAEMRGNYALDLGAVLRKNTTLGDSLEFALVPVPFEGRTPKTTSVSLEGIELEIARSVVETSQR